MGGECSMLREMRKAYEIVVETCEGKQPFGRYRHR
jgi:hypothetical protein